LSGLREAAERLIAAPFIGTLRPEIYPNLRFLRRDSAVFWFIADGEREKVLVVAIFFGPQDHTRRMLARLLDDLP
jgi:plasmid stabilization system protein ParE